METEMGKEVERNALEWLSQLSPDVVGDITIDLLKDAEKTSKIQEQNEKIEKLQEKIQNLQHTLIQQQDKMIRQQQEIIQLEREKEFRKKKYVELKIQLQKKNKAIQESLCVVNQYFGKVVRKEKEKLLLLLSLLNAI